MDQNQSNKQYKIDLYSIPVFLLELVILAALAYLAYFMHFQHKHTPLVNGFYCDDIAYRQQFQESTFTTKFIRKSDEITVTALLLAIPIVTIIFCELVNSMFGALNFRLIRAGCACCKLHSITRRTLRFSAAYLLGFLIVMISCDILAQSTGRLRPYFAQDCPSAYQQCLQSPSFRAPQMQPRDSSSISNKPISGANPSMEAPLASASPLVADQAKPTASLPASSQIKSSAATGLVAASSAPLVAAVANQPAEVGALAADGGAGGRPIIVERQWVDLGDVNLYDLCNYSLDSTQLTEGHRFQQIATSWPSFPAAIFTYSILFSSCYLCFVGTARPFRLLTCIIVMFLFLLGVVFNVQLVKEHYQHWEDVVSSSILALLVVAFILHVYLNKFRDVHYYENQKLFNKPARSISHSQAHADLKGYNNDIAMNEFGHHNNNLDKDGNNLDDDRMSGHQLGSGNQQVNDPIGSGSNNDLAMRYFQIPRANYRGAPRPISSLNQML